MITQSAARRLRLTLLLLLGVACWPSTSRAQKIDPSQIGKGTFLLAATPASGPTGPNNETFLFSVGNCSPSTEYGAVHSQNATDGATGCVEAPAGGFAPVYNAVAGYCRGNLNASCNGGYFQGRCLVNSSSCWGLNTAVQDGAGLTGVSLTGQEADVYVNNAGSVGVGFSLNGNFAAQSANLPGFIVNKPNFNSGTGQWTAGLVVADGATTGNAIQVGVTATTPTNSVGSQKIQFFGRDAGGVTREADINSDLQGNLVLSHPATRGLIEPNLVNTPAITNPSGTSLAVPTVGANLISDTATQTLTNKTVNFGATLQKPETQAADANVLTVTPLANAGLYRACVSISVSSATSGVIAWTLSWTDSNGNAQSNVAQDLFQDGTAAPATTFTTNAAGNYHFCRELDVNNAAANIVVKWVGGGTSAAKMSASLERLI